MVVNLIPSKKNHVQTYSIYQFSSRKNSWNYVNSISAYSSSCTHVLSRNHSISFLTESTPISVPGFPASEMHNYLSVTWQRSDLRCWSATTGGASAASGSPLGNYSITHFEALTAQCTGLERLPEEEGVRSVQRVLRLPATIYWNQSVYIASFCRIPINPDEPAGFRFVENV